VGQHLHIGQRAPDAGLYAFQQGMAALDRPRTRDEYMNRYEPAGTRLAGAQIVVLYPVLPKLLQQVPNKVLLINGKGAVHETRHRVPHDPDPGPDDIAR